MPRKDLGTGLTWEIYKGNLVVSVSGEGTMRLLARVMLILLFGNVVLGCLFSMPCSQLLPTISYLGCFPGHERLHVFTCLFFSLCLLVLYTGAYIRLSPSTPCIALCTSLILGLSITVTLVVLTLIDEINGLYFSPLDWMHDYVLIILLLLCLCYIYLTYGCLGDIRDSMSAVEQTALRRLKRHIYYTLGAVFLAILEWQIAYSIYSNSLFNETFQAISEWLAISLSVFLPVRFCSCFENYRLTVSIAVAGPEAVDTELENKYAGYFSSNVNKMQRSSSLLEPPPNSPMEQSHPHSLAALFLGVKAGDPTPQESTPIKLTSETESLLSSAHSTPQKGGKVGVDDGLGEENQGKRRVILRNNSRFLGIWLLLRDLCLMYSLLTTSFYLAFHHPGDALQIVDLIIWIIFILDIFVTFFSAYIDEDGQEVCDFRKIAENYITGYFFLDVVAVIPLTFANLEEIEYYLRMVRLLKAKKTLDLLDGYGLGSVLPFCLRLYLGREFRIALQDKHKAMIMHILLYLGFVTYTTACVWFWYTEKVQEVSTNYFISAGSFKSRFPEGTSDWQYLERSWYYIITTFATIGYGDLAASNFYETLMLIFVVALGVASYSMIIGEFQVIVSELHSLKNERLSDFHLWIAEIESVQGPLEPGLKSRLARAYTLFDSQDRLRGMLVKWWEGNTAEDFVKSGHYYLDNVPEATLRAIKDYLFDDIFALFGHSFFRSVEFRYDICLNLHPRVYARGQMILTENDEVTEILLVTKGRVAVGPTIDGVFSPALLLPQNCVLGLYSAFHKSDAFTSFKVASSDPVSGWAIPVKPFLQVIKEKHTEHAKYLFVESNKQTKFIQSAISIHRQHLQKDKCTSPLLDFMQGSRFSNRNKEEKLSILDSFVGKEAEFVFFM